MWSLRNILLIFGIIKIDESYKSSVELANGKSVTVEGIGTGELTFVDKQGVHKRMVTEVLYAPCLVGNMLSVRHLTKIRC